MRQYRDSYRDENLNEQLIIAKCTSVTVADIMCYLDENLIREFLNDMRDKTLNRAYLGVSSELATHVLKSAVWDAAANHAAKIQFGDNDNLEVRDGD